ncbi:hypothetical protein [Streptomyces sp. 2A115]|uniref:hypothetical protein n=1 Tax=Streptomyces sp. 2A115 TaxID=3457439 RepID=UPI003FD4954D
MRILFSGTPAYGHLLPLLPLERAARKAGHATAFLTHASLGDLVAPSPVLSAGASLEETLGEFRRRTGTDAAEDMSPATAGEFFGGTRVDLGADAAPAAARGFGTDLVVAETADFLGPLAASHLGVPWASHGVGIALESPLPSELRPWAPRRSSVRPGRRARPSSVCGRSRPTVPRPGRRPGTSTR